MHWMPGLIRRFAAALVVALAASAAAGGAGAQALEEGKQYVKLRNPQPTESGNKIEVIEFFSYGCPHCAHLEPILDQWLKTLPPDVAFRRVPVLFNPSWANLAKIYYTLDALGDEARLTPLVFRAIHDQGQNLSNEKTFTDWIGKQGVDPKKVDDMLNSFAVSGKVNKAKSQAAAYRIESVPTLIVDGKYVTGPDKAGSHEQIPGVLNALIAKARAERPKT